MFRGPKNSRASVRNTQAHFPTSLAACVATAALAAAAHGRRADSGGHGRMYFEHLTMRDGLSMSTVNSILQDSQGYVWLGNGSGLNRYDGYSVRQFRRERGNAHGLASDYIWSMAEDSHGDLWLATDGGGVARWDRHTETIPVIQARSRTPQSWRATGARTGDRFQGTGLGGNQGSWSRRSRSDARGAARHYRHQRLRCPFIAGPMPIGAAVRRSTRHDSGSARTPGLSRYDASTDGFINVYGDAMSAAQLHDLRVRAIREDHTGTLWIGTVNGGLAFASSQNGNHADRVPA